MELFGMMCFGIVCVMWLLTPKDERRPLFKKSGKLYCDGDNT